MHLLKKMCREISLPELSHLFGMFQLSSKDPQNITAMSLTRNLIISQQKREFSL